MENKHNDSRITTSLTDVKALLNAIEYFGLKEKVGHSWEIVNKDVGEVIKNFPQPK